MKRYLFVFLLGAAGGACGVWYLEHGLGEENPKEQMIRKAEDLRDTVKEHVKDITAEAIRAELEETQMVVREKAKEAGSAIMDATANARTTAAIKAKLVKESGLSAFKINVDTAQGVVTLSGTLPTHEQVAKAVELALETDGVTKVVSTIQVAE